MQYSTPSLVYTIHIILYYNYMYMYIYMHFQVCFGFSKHTVQKWSLHAVLSVREYNMSLTVLSGLREWSLHAVLSVREYNVSLTVLSGLREKQITKSSSCSEASNHNCVNAHVHVHSCTQKIGYKFRRKNL